MLSGFKISNPTHRQKHPVIAFKLPAARCSEVKTLDQRLDNSELHEKPSLLVNIEQGNATDSRTQ